MIINKQVGIFLNLVHFQFKKFLNSLFQKHGCILTPEQFLVMDTLWDEEGVLFQQQIADILIKDKNSVVKLIDALEDKGLVTRVADLEDKRQKQIHLTQKALELKESATTIALASTDAIIEGISKSDLLIFLKVLEAMSSNINSHSGTLL
ncbi:MAG: MarR family transcriptional regulator [Bacteroidales bacterium]